MASTAERQVPVVLDLWQVQAQDLVGMLEEETGTWREELNWDFRPSAELVRRFVDVHALNGYVLLIDDEVAGYAYYVCEEHKGLVGDLYIRKKYRTAENEHRLLGAVVDHLVGTRYVKRIESQLVLARSLESRMLPGASYARSHPRYFMEVDAGVGAKLPARALEEVVLDRWSERWQDETAHLIASAYRGHIDSEINDQYRSAAGARRFLFNIVQHPGCGTFFEPAACVAVRENTGKLCGASLTSLVAADAGHVTQICVAPALKGQGVGYELLRRSLGVLAQAGAKTVSLTVTAANRDAVRLYERVGFRITRQFSAFVWEGF
jgi:ribosomal protein S18 acetylase RimI-like enzyme